MLFRSNNKIKIRYLFEKLVYHQNIGPETNIKKENHHQHMKKYKQYFTGHIRFLTKHFKFKYVIIYSIKWIFNRLIVAIAFNYYISFFKTIIALPRVVKESLKKRAPVKIEVQQYYRNGNIPLIDRDFFPKFKKPFN